jgi:hypothetical protein
VKIHFYFAHIYFLFLQRYIINRSDYFKEEMIFMIKEAEYVTRWKNIIDKDISDLFLRFGAVLGYIQHILTFDPEAKDPELVKASNVSRLEIDPEKKDKAIFFILFYRYDILMTLIDEDKNVSKEKEREIFAIMVDQNKLNDFLTKIKTVRNGKILDNFN